MHSHLAIRHLIRQLDLSGRPEPATAAPQWLTNFLVDAAAQFEPFSGTARAGYECRHTPDGWEAALFLGMNELVGGADDGCIRPVNFRFDVLQLTQRFEHVDSISWNAFPNRYSDGETDLSMLTLIGRVSGETIRLQVYAAAPEECGPAMRVYTDGRCEVVGPGRR